MTLLTRNDPLPPILSECPDCWASRSWREGAPVVGETRVDLVLPTHAWAGLTLRVFWREVGGEWRELVRRPDWNSCAVCGDGEGEDVSVLVPLTP